MDDVMITWEKSWLDDHDIYVDIIEASDVSYSQRSKKSSELNLDW